MALLRAALVDRDERLQKNAGNLMQAQLQMQVRCCPKRQRFVLLRQAWMETRQHPMNVADDMQFGYCGACRAAVHSEANLGLDAGQG